MLAWGRSIMENLLTASLTIRHKMSVVTGEKERKRSAVEMSRTSGAGASSVADRTSETFWSKKSAKASALRPVAGCEALSPPLPSPLLIVRQRDAGSRRVFLLYTADLGELAASLGLSSHFYAYDSQIYTWGHPSSDGSQRRRMELGVERTAEWMRSNRLCLSSEKTEFLWCATSRRCPHLDTGQLNLC